MSIIQGTSKAAGGAVYEIDQSIRFNDDDSARLARTVSSSGSLTTWTLSGWIKRGKYTVNTNGQWFPVFSASAGSTAYDAPFNFNDVSTGGAFNVYIGGYQWRTSALARDTSAWYHVVTVWDSSNGTASDRMRLYINGERVTDFSISATPSSGANSRWNSSSYSHHRIGNLNYNGGETTYIFDGYLAEINFVDGTALDPTSFGEYNADGVWIPIQYDGSYGTNGFYITGATASDLGEDFSGNSNDFTSSGLATTDQMLDTPTKNFCTLNPIEPNWGGAVTLSDGNLALAGTAATVWNNAVATFKTLPSTGKWIWASEPNTSGAGRGDPWIVNETGLASRNNYVYIDANGWETTFDTASVKASLNNGASITTSHSYGAGDFNVVCFDADTKKLWFGLFDVSASELKFQDSSGGLTGDPAAGTNQTYTLTGNEFSIGFATYTGRSGVVDFGQSNLLSQFTAPTDFKTLCTTNLPTPSITDGSAYFQTSLWNGNSSTQTITQSGNSTFEPGMIWSKGRNNIQEHVIFDQVRGTTKYIQTDNTGAEGTQSGVTAFNSDGFDLGSWAVSNGSGQTHVGWQWKANGAGSSNTDGSITSTVSNNSTAGFSIGTYTGIGTGPGDASGTVGHGLGISPGMIIIKDLTAATEWYVWHQGMSNPAQSFIYLNTTGAAQTSTATWDNTAPTSSVFSIGWDTNVNTSGNSHVFYAFAEIPGYSSIGSYTGNSSTDGTFVYTGFKPSFILTKNINTADQWGIRDATRNPFNVTDKLLNPNAATAETSSSTGYIDILSNGFKPRSSDSNINTQTIIYMAFAEHPFANPDGAPATAR